MKIEFVKPSLDKVDLIKRYREKFLLAGDSMDGTSFLANYDVIEEWLESQSLTSSPQTVPPGLVYGETFLVLAKEDKRLVGMINLRYELNDYLYDFGGHIGYSVAPDERRKGIAKKMLGIALEKYQKREIRNVLVTCDEDNTASNQTIIKNGGQLENTVVLNGATINRYWIKL